VLVLIIILNFKLNLTPQISVLGGSKEVELCQPKRVLRWRHSFEPMHQNLVTTSTSKKFFGAQ
jgi:hypothetical protein